jgi:hypothetical protein
LVAVGVAVFVEVREKENATPREFPLVAHFRPLRTELGVDLEHPPLDVGKLREGTTDEKTVEVRTVAPSTCRRIADQGIRVVRDDVPIGDEEPIDAVHAETHGIA